MARVDIVLLDMDGVLVDFITPALALHSGGRLESFYEQYPGQPYIQKVLGISDERFCADMDEDWWAGLEWMHDGKKILSILEDAFGRERIMIASSPVERQGCVEGKRRWIRRNLPKHYHGISGQMFGKKKWLMAHPTTLLVDDFDDQVDPFEQRGGLVLHVPRPWNRLHYWASDASKLVETAVGLMVKIKST